MQKYIIIFLAVLLIGVVIYFMTCNSPIERAYEIPDSNVVNNYVETIKHDTIVKWYENRKEAKPEVIYAQNVDSIFIASTDDKDVMLSVDKKGNKLHIFALNRAGKILKESFYTVGNDFTATSAFNRVFVKTKMFYWTGIEVSAESYLPINNLGVSNLKYQGSIESGVSYMDKLSLKAGLEYNGEINAKLKLSYHF